MSNALAIAAVTAILRDRLNDGLLNANLDSIGQFSVTSSPPDRLESGETRKTGSISICGTPPAMPPGPASGCRRAARKAGGSTIPGWRWICITS